MTERADVCIVGGGFTGLWAALQIKRLAPDADIVLIEREYCGAGASGRNGGWVNGWDDILPKLVSRFGQDAALWLVDASRRSLDDIRETVREGEIDCDLAFEGGLTVALSPAQVEGILEAAQLAREMGRDDYFRILDREEAMAMSGAPRAEAGALILHAGSVQPALLVQGLRRWSPPPACASTRRPRWWACAQPARYCEDTLWERDGGQGRSWPPAPGSASCPTLRRTIFIIPSHVVATERPREALDRLGWQAGRPFSDGRTAVHYAQRSSDDRLVFGRGGGRLGYGGRIIPAHFHDAREIAARRGRHARHAADDARPRDRVAFGEGPWSAPSTGSPGWAPSASTTTCSTAWATRATASRPQPHRPDAGLGRAAHRR